MKRLFTFLLGMFAFSQLIFAQVNHTPPHDDDVIKLLAIGNSFSEDGIENYLHELAAATNKKMIIGNLYIAGASLELHVKNINKDASTYNYRKISLAGNKTVTKDVSIATALAEENWDYISFQQASPMSGKYDVIIKSLPELVDYVRKHVSPQTQFVYHQTWAYQQDSKHDGFKHYNQDQLTMFNGILDAAKKVAKTGYFTYIIPAGTAIQNARTSSIGDKYTRDGYHLQLDYGRFTAACTWYEKLFKEDVRKNPYKPEKVTDLQAKIAKQAAHKACKKPYKISKIKL